MTISVAQKKKQSFFREVIQELKKVTWTTKPELILSTKAVVLAILAFGLGIYLADLAIRGVIEGLGIVFRKLLG